MNKDQITAVLTDLVELNGGEDNGRNLPDQLSEVLYSWSGKSEAKQPDGFTVAKEDSYGGEGQGEQYWAVYSITKTSGERVYVRFDGFYESYNGHEWHSGFEVVTPKEVMKTEWVGAE